MKHPEIIIKPPLVVFDEKKHTYTAASGDLYSGCSTVASLPSKDFLGPWYAKEMAEKLKALKRSGVVLTDGIIDEAKKAAPNKATIAKDNGTAVHNVAEQFVNSQIDGVVREMQVSNNEEITNGTNALLKWHKSHPGIQYLMSEEVVSSQKDDVITVVRDGAPIKEKADNLKIAGKIDFVARIGGKLTLGDFKTSKMISEDYPIQLAGYDIMLRAMGLICEAWMIVRLPKDGAPFEEMVIHDPDEMEFFRRTFLHLREAHRYRVYWENRHSYKKGRPPDEKKIEEVNGKLMRAGKTVKK